MYSLAAFTASAHCVMPDVCTTLFCPPPFPSKPPSRCAPEDLAKERGAVMEELRMGNDSQGRMMAAHWKALMKGCK